MDKKRKANKFNILFVALIVIAGLLLMYTGNDALVLATEKKEGILTAEQVQVSFDSNQHICPIFHPYPAQ